MVTHRQHTELNESYFITFTCYEWINLFHITNLYNYFEKWFRYLHQQNALLLAYVIMLNHFHGIVHLKSDCDASLNKLVGNGKRFLSYEIVDRLGKMDAIPLLKKLNKGVDLNEQLISYSSCHLTPSSVLTGRF